MAYQFSGTDPQIRFSPGAFVGYGLRQSAFTVAALIKRDSISSWQGIWTMDQGSSTVYHDWLELDPTNQLALWNGGIGTGDITFATGTALTDTTEWTIVALTFGPASPGSAATPRWDWKVGAAELGDRNRSV